MCQKEGYPGSVGIRIFPVSHCFAINVPVLHGLACIEMKRFLSVFLTILFLSAIIGLSPYDIEAAAYPFSFPPETVDGEKPMPVIGFIDSHLVEEGQTLLQIARIYGLGYNQMALYHPEIDPWLPEAGMVIDIPSKWIPPPTRHRAVVVNIPEMRLYRFFEEHHMVRTYPIGIGREGFNTPVMETRVVAKIENPSWTVPPSAWEKYGRKIMPPGPENPLGDYWIGLAANNIGIHGTNFPWGVGRRVSHGCIRLYPEHAAQFYHEVDRGMIVEILYEPVKVGVRGDLVFLEAHPDIYELFPDLETHAWTVINGAGVADIVDPLKVRQCIDARKGVPTLISRDP